MKAARDIRHDIQFSKCVRNKSDQTLAPYDPPHPLGNALIYPNEARHYYCSNGGRRYFTAADSCVLAAY